MSKCFVQIRAYNAEEHIKRAIDSVLMQDYPDVEVIVLDDGSIDKTKEMVESYKNQKVHYIHQENKGPAGAFRTIVAETLSRASDDDYVFSLDSDDFYTRKDALSGTVKRMKENDANICVIGMEFLGDKNFILQPGAGAKHREVVEKLAAKNQAVNIENAPFIINADTTLWSKVYRKDILQKYVDMLPDFAPDLKVCEDFPATVTLLMKDAKVISNPDTFYGFYKRSDSITSKPTVANFDRDRVQFTKITQQIVRDNPDEFFPVAPIYINKFVKAKYDIISGIVDAKIKSGDLPADYSVEQFQNTFKKEIDCRFFAEENSKQANDSVLPAKLKKLKSDLQY